MAIDKRLQIYDEQGSLVDYDILASDVKFLPDGKDLPTKLAEMQDDIEDAGSGDGTVTGVKVNGTTHEPNDQGVVDIGTVITQHQDISQLATKTELASKVDKNGTDSLMTAAEHTKLAGIAAGAQVNAINSISVNGTQQTPVNGNVNISVGEGSVESVTVSGTKYTPDINGDVNLGDLRGQDGNSGVASADGVESVNNLNGGKTDTQSKVYVLGANQGKRLRDQIELVYQRIQTLYGLLGNIAFWDGKPASSALLPNLDWGAPKHKVTLSLSLTNAVVKDSLGNTKVNGAEIQVEEGGTLTLTVEPSSGYALTGAPTVSTGATVDDNQDGTYSVAITMGQSDMSLSISATAEQAHSVNPPILTGCTLVSGPTGIADGEGGTFVFAANTDLLFPIALGSDAVSGATIASYTVSGTTATLVIEDVNDDVTIAITAKPLYDFHIGMFVDVSRSKYYPQNKGLTNRACLLSYRGYVQNSCTWNTSGVSSSNYRPQDLLDYSAIPIPSGATKVSLQCDATYWHGLGLVDVNGAVQNNDFNWVNGTKTEYNFADYPNATHIFVNFAKGSGRTDNFSNETLADMGVVFSIE